MIESMRPTEASKHPRVIEANGIIKEAALKDMDQLIFKGDATGAMQYRNFLNGKK